MNMDRRIERTTTDITKLRVDAIVNGPARTRLKSLETGLILATVVARKEYVSIRQLQQAERSTAPGL